MPAPDAAIVGGGIVGTTLAAELAGRGLRVALYERAGVAAAASGRNSGAVWRPADPVLAALYAETLAMYRGLPAALAERLPASHPARRFALPAAPAGLLALDPDQRALRALAGAEAAASPELGAAYVDPDSLRRLEPAVAHGLGAVRYDICFPVEPAAATRAMAAFAQSLGADIREGVEVTAVARRGSRASGVVTVGGRIEPAGCVVVAAGPWTPALVDPGGGWRPIRPWWGVVVELALGEAAPRHVLEAAPVGEHAGGRPETGFSLVTAAGRSSLGSTFLPDEPDTAGWAGPLRERGARYVPAMAASPAVGLRACARPVTADGRPLAGAVPGTDELWVAAGHGPWGLSTGPATARHVAALVAGEADPRSAAVLAGTRADRFGEPGAAGGRR